MANLEENPNSSSANPKLGSQGSGLAAVADSSFMAQPTLTGNSGVGVGEQAR